KAHDAGKKPALDSIPHQRRQFNAYQHEKPSHRFRAPRDRTEAAKAPCSDTPKVETPPAIVIPSPEIMETIDLTVETFAYNFPTAMSRRADELGPEDYASLDEDDYMCSFIEAESDPDDSEVQQTTIQVARSRNISRRPRDTTTENVLSDAVSRMLEEVPEEAEDTAAPAPGPPRRQLPSLDEAISEKSANISQSLSPGKSQGAGPTASRDIDPHEASSRGYNSRRGSRYDSSSESSGSFDSRRSSRYDSSLESGASFNSRRGSRYDSASESSGSFNSRRGSRLDLEVENPSIKRINLARNNSVSSKRSEGLDDLLENSKYPLFGDDQDVLDLCSSYSSASESEESGPSRRPFTPPEHVLIPQRKASLMIARVSRRATDADRRFPK
ncbi:MAG: hypothetical protein SGCHY_004281, partial [Lobulomycetales sp.]